MLTCQVLQTWMGAPSIYVYDCNNAGIIVESFRTFAEQHEREYAEQIRNIHSQGGSADLQPPTSLRSVSCAAQSRPRGNLNVIHTHSTFPRYGTVGSTTYLGTSSPPLTGRYPFLLSTYAHLSL